MKKCNFILFILVSSIWITYGQTKKDIDSINLYLQTIKIDTVKVAALNEYAWKYRRSDSIASIYANQALAISEKLSYTDGKSTSFMRLSAIESFAGNYIESEKYALQSLAIEEDRKNLKQIFRAKFQLTKLYNKIADYDRALKYADESLYLTNKLNDSASKAKILSVKGSIYENKIDLSNALIYHEKAIKIREQLEKKNGLAKSYLKYANLLNSLKKYENEFEYLQKGKLLSMFSNDEILLSKFYNNLGSNFYSRKEIDSAIFYYKKSLSLKEKYTNVGKEIVYANLGNIYQNKKQLKIAEDYYLKSLRISKKVNNKKQEANTAYNLGNIYLKQGNYNKAIKSLHNSLEISEKVGNRPLELSVLKSLAESYERKGDFQKSSLYNEKHIVLRDDMDKIIREADLVRSNYVVERRENERLYQKRLLDNEKLKSAQGKEERQALTLYFVCGLLIVTSILFFAVLRFRKEKREKEIITQKNIELLKKQELKSIKAMIDGQEKERKRIAQDLHDRLGSMLSMVKLHYKSVEDSLDKLQQENKTQYEKASLLLDEACEAVREIAHEMISGVLTKFGLTAALEELKDTLESSNTLAVELIVFGLDDRLENRLEMEIYGIIQELIHNVIKHANAKELTIQLLKKENKLELIVEDDGDGFDIYMIDEKEGIGLKSVYSRVDDLFGEIEIDSGKGNGTTITMQIPLDI